MSFAPAHPVSGIGGTEPRAAVAADGTRYVTWQGGDLVARSFDGQRWDTVLGGHTAPPFSPTDPGSELFDAGDVDVAVGVDGTIYVSSLALNTTEGIGVDIVSSHDGGKTWTLVNPHAGEAASDRPWIAAGPGPGDLVLYEKDLHVEAPVVRVSHDGGRTFGPISPVITDPALADFAVQVYDGNFQVAHDGTIYVPFIVPNAVDQSVGAPSSQSFPITNVVVGVGHENPTTHVVTFVDRVIPPPLHLPSTGNAAYVFPTLALDTADEPVVACSQGPTYAGPYDVYLSSCATTCGDPVAEANPLSGIWSDPVKVTAPPGNHVFPSIVAGSPGRLAVAWYGTPYTGDTTGGPGAGSLGAGAAPADWRTYVATTTDWVPGSSRQPTFDVTDASGHVVHHGNICLGGTFCDLAGAPTCPPLGCGDRAMADNLGLALGPDGGTLVTWTDYSTGSGLVFAACQATGPSLLAGHADLSGCGVSASAPGPSLPEAPSAALLVVVPVVLGFGWALWRRRRRG